MEEKVSILNDWPVSAYGEDMAGNPQTRVACTFMPFNGEVQTNALPSGRKPTTYVVVTQFDSAEGLIDLWERTHDRSQVCAKGGCNPDHSDLNNRDDDWAENEDRTVQYIVNVQHKKIQHSKSSFTPVGAGYTVKYRAGLFHCEAYFITKPDGNRDVQHVWDQLETMARNACPVVI